MTTDPSPVGRGSAYGKIILLGEHAVVYGAPALAAGIDRGARAEARRLEGSGASGGVSTLDLGGGPIAADPGGDDLARAFAALLDSLPAPAPPVAVTAASELTPGGGLGSSAALGVAIARAIEALVAPGDEASTDRVVERAMAWERVFHGNPSGIDTTAAAHGGVFRFTRADGARPIAPAQDVWLCIGWSGEASSTRVMVESVARQRARRPEIVDTSVAGITSLVDNAALAIEAGDLSGLGRLMDSNQMLLAGLMLSTDALETMCRTARDAGALGAKLTGAGGGGSVVALAPSARLGHLDVDETSATEAARRIVGAWEAAGFSGFVACVRGEARPARGTP